MRLLTSTLIFLSLIALCSPDPLPKLIFSNTQCMICRFGVSLINYSLRLPQGSDFVYKFTNNFCYYARIESPSVCSQVTKLFNKEVVKVLSKALFTPDQLCGLLSNNTCGHANNPFDDWEVQLEASENIDQNLLARERLEFLQDQKKETTKPYRVFHLSDVHVDLNYLEGSPAKCLEPMCCRKTSTPNNSLPNLEQSSAGYWGSNGQCDIPMRTFESSLDFIKKTIDDSSDIDYIIWTGDIQPHNVWEQSKKTATDIYDAVFEQIFKRLPNVKIFPTLGNHEMVPVDSFSPSNLLNVALEDSPEWLYRKLETFWSRWLPADTMPTITKDGFYSTMIRAGLKLISLNTNFCHKTNFWLYINSTDPGNQLQWLVHELQISELLHEKVHIIGHIPPGCSDCLKVWSKNFNRIVRRYSKTISGQFYGHTHRDEFELFYNQEEPNISSTEWKPISVGFVGPSVTTFVDLNPSVRIYTIDPDRAFQTIDFENFVLDLKEANSKGATVKPEWQSKGSFSQLFNLDDTSPLSLHELLLELVHDLKKDDIQNNRLFQLYRQSYSYSDLFDRNQFNSMSLKEKKEFLCQYFTSQSQNLNACDLFIGSQS